MKQMKMQSFLIALISVVVTVSADIDWNNVHPVTVLPLKMKAAGKNAVTANSIVGAVEAPKNRFPYVAGLIIDVGQPTFTGWCVAVLVSQEWALSAAHCLSPNNAGVTLLLGYHNISQDDPGTEKIQVGPANIKIHEQFNKDDLKNDIAMIKFDKPVTLTEKINIISLYAQPIPDGSPVNVVGWGQTAASPPNRPDLLMYINTTVLDLKSCKGKIYTMPTETNICTDGAQGKNSGFGDSGGPLTFTKPDGETVLIGVSSFAVIGFPVGAPSAFTRTTSYLDWIEKTSGIKPK